MKYEEEALAELRRRTNAASGTCVSMPPKQSQEVESMDFVSAEETKIIQRDSFFPETLNKETKLGKEDFLDSTGFGTQCVLRDLNKLE